MGHNLIIVESQKKAKQIAKILGKGWTVQACFGHICDLPAKEYGIDKETWEEVYQPNNERQQATIAKLRATAKRADHVYLAPDPDREGEAIAWHLVRELHLKKGEYSRVEWNEITAKAVRHALDNARDLDWNRIEAQRSRRQLDRMIGWEVSPRICWPAGFKAAGRVQNPTLHIICERERAIRDFVAQDYFTLSVNYSEGFSAYVPEEISITLTDEAGETKTTRRIRSMRYTTEAEAIAARSEAESNPHIVRSIGKTKTKRAPHPAYKTSALQRDAEVKLGLNPTETMELAQELYESGYITYMRTDSTRLSDEFITDARDRIAREHPEALSNTPNKGKAGDQDGHEAIRPATGAMDSPLDDVSAKARKLFAMIMARALASQCKPAIFDKTVIGIKAGGVDFRAEGSVLVESGFLHYWEPYGRENEDTDLPLVQESQTLNPTEYELDKNKTSPPARYSRTDLVEAMERSGIGRPSTFAKTVEILQGHGYAKLEQAKKKVVLVPTEDGMHLDSMLMIALPPLVETKYTADMETSLDTIEQGVLNRRGFLDGWWAGFASMLTEAEGKAAGYRSQHGLKSKSTGKGFAEETDLLCDRCQSANYLKIKRKTGTGNFLKCAAEDCGFIRDVRVKTRKGGCPVKDCGGTLVERKRKDKKAESFFACAKCSHTQNLDGSRSSGAGVYQKPEETTKTCPRCEKRTLLLWKVNKPTEGKTDFYRCPDDQCKFSLTFGARASKIKCEKDGGLMLERVWKGNRFWGCAKCGHTRPINPA